MKFKRSRYPRHPSTERYSSPCWTLTGRWIWVDIDWNTRFPFGASIGVTFGHKPAPGSGDRALGFCLDVNAPLGEPNRLYLTGPRRDWMVGLITWWTFRETSQQSVVRNGRTITQIEGDDVRCRPRLERGQAWDWKRSEGGDRWRWLVIHPADWRERWARAHPVEAAEAERRSTEREARKAADGT